MTAWQRDLTALEPWHRSFEVSRRRRDAVPRLRRQVARRKRASTAVAAAMLAGPAAQATAAAGSRSAPEHIAIAGERVDRPSTRLNEPPYLLLRDGSTGPAVAKVQRRLGIEDDGHYGRKTEHAVRLFQGNHGLEVDGVVGPKTWRALFGVGREAASFAVRRATESELERLDLDSHALPRSPDRSAAVAAIELHMPALKRRGKSSASGKDGGTASSSRDRTTRDRKRGSRESSAASDSRRDSSRPGAARNQPREASTPTATGSCAETLKWPTTATNVSSGYRTSGRPSHAGVDIDGGLSDEGNPVYAAACGVITLMQGSSESGGYGNFVCVKHTDRFVTCYAHLSRFASVSTGNYVRRGEVIGAVGNTGHSFGAHLHFETRRGTPYRDSDDSDFDPLPYLNGLPIPGDPVTPPSSGVGGPDFAELGPEPQRSALAHRRRAADPARSSDSNRTTGGGEAAIDALEAESPPAASESAGEGSIRAESSWPRTTGASQREADRHERAVASSTGQPWSEGESRELSGQSQADHRFSTSASTSSAPGRWSTKATPSAANGGESGVSNQEEGVAANRPERGGSDEVGWVASSRDEKKGSPHEESGASAPGQDDADSWLKDAYATESPEPPTSGAEPPDVSPLADTVDDQSTGHEAESAAPEEPGSGRAQVTPHHSDSSGTAGAVAGEHPGRPPRGHPSWRRRPLREPPPQTADAGEPASHDPSDRSDVVELANGTRTRSAEKW